MSARPYVEQDVNLIDCHTAHNASAARSYLLRNPTLPLPILGRELDRLLPHCGGGWVGVRVTPGQTPCRAQMRTRSSSPTNRKSGSRPDTCRDRRRMSRGTPVPIALIYPNWVSRVQMARLRSA